MICAPGRLDARQIPSVSHCRLLLLQALSFGECLGHGVDLALLARLALAHDLVEHCARLGHAVLVALLHILHVLHTLGWQVVIDVAEEGVFALGVDTCDGFGILLELLEL